MAAVPPSAIGTPGEKEMNRGTLSSYFTAVAGKRLRAVEANPNTSNQHEFNGVQELRQILGSSKRTFEATFLFLGEDDEETVAEEAWVTWYDAREAHPTRSEFRLYFPTTPVSERAAEGDLVVFAIRPDGRMMVIRRARTVVAPR